MRAAMPHSHSSRQPPASSVTPKGSVTCVRPVAARCAARAFPASEPACSGAGGNGRRGQRQGATAGGSVYSMCWSSGLWGPTQGLRTARRSAVAASGHLILPRPARCADTLLQAYLRRVRGVVGHEPAGDGDAAHVQQVDEVGEAAQLCVLRPRGRVRALLRLRRRHSQSTEGSQTLLSPPLLCREGGRRFDEHSMQAVWACRAWLLVTRAHTCSSATVQWLRAVGTSRMSAPLPASCARQRARSTAMPALWSNTSAAQNLPARTHAHIRGTQAGAQPCQGVGCGGWVSRSSQRCVPCGQWPLCLAAAAPLPSAEFACTCSKQVGIRCKWACGR